MMLPFKTPMILVPTSAKRGGISYTRTERPTPEPTFDELDAEVLEPSVTAVNEGYIDVRFVFGREIDPDINGVYLWRVERINDALPEGTTKDDIEYAIHTFWDDPHELVSDISDAFKGVL
jgi:hypothetical protein